MSHLGIFLLIDFPPRFWVNFLLFLHAEKFWSNARHCQCSRLLSGFCCAPLKGLEFYSGVHFWVIWNLLDSYEASFKMLLGWVQNRLRLKLIYHHYSENTHEDSTNAQCILRSSHPGCYKHKLPSALCELQGLFCLPLWAAMSPAFFPSLTYVRAPAVPRWSLSGAPSTQPSALQVLLVCPLSPPRNETTLLSHAPSPQWAGTVTSPVSPSHCLVSMCDSCAWRIPSHFLVIYGRRVIPTPVTSHWPESDVENQKSVTFSEDVSGLMFFFFPLEAEAFFYWQNLHNMWGRAGHTVPT